MSEGGHIEFTIDDGQSIKLRLGEVQPVSETKTTWRVEWWMDYGGKWCDGGTRYSKDAALDLQRHAVANWWSGALKTRIIRIETREFVEEER